MTAQAADIPFRFVAKTTDVEPGKSKCYPLEGRNVLVIHMPHGGFKAIENQCSHEKKSMEGARIRAGKIVCPHHGANFDLETGKAMGAPAVLPITVYPVKVEGEDVLVQLIEPKKKPGNPFAIPGAGGYF
jgi:3-phenylpropionate/trans-cinnamate dioxygenase ferredoxin subunit